MSRKTYRPMVSGFCETSRDHQVLQEIDNFMMALSSYPDRVAQEPTLSFEQYLFRINAAGETRGNGDAVQRVG